MVGQRQTRPVSYIGDKEVPWPNGNRSISRFPGLATQDPSPPRLYSDNEIPFMWPHSAVAESCLRLSARFSPLPRCVLGLSRSFEVGR